MICLVTLQNVSAAEIRQADIEYRYEGITDSGGISHGYMIREQETKRIKLTRKSRTQIAIKFSQPDNVNPVHKIQLAETENRTVVENAVRIKTNHPDPINPAKTTAAALISPPEEKVSSHPSCEKNIVFLPLNGSRISNPEKDQINQFINCLKGKEVRVEGFTCKIGKKSYNDKLAKARAHNVAEYLQQEGVVVKEIIGKGRQGYISRLDFINRRVEIKQI
jgi:outer membrane protein OmpA-like peptidoglycan-associated protein